MNYLYLINLILGIIYVIFGIFLITKILPKYNDKKEKINLIFLILISLFYALNFVDSIFAGYGGNLHNVTPLSNISPLLFSLCVICIFLPRKGKSVLYPLFSMFNVVMALAVIPYNVICLFSSQYYWWFLLFDEFTHLTYFLFVFYLLFSTQVSIAKKDLFRSYFFIYSVILIAILINVIFSTSLFGLTFNENYSIYGVKFFSNYIISDLVYLLSLGLIMFVGYFLSKKISSIRKNSL